MPHHGLIYEPADPTFAVHYPLHKTDREGSEIPHSKQLPAKLTLHRLLLEFVQICKAVAIGFGVMGFIGYFVKLIHIPM